MDEKVTQILEMNFTKCVKSLQTPGSTLTKAHRITSGNVVVILRRLLESHKTEVQRNQRYVEEEEEEEQESFISIPTAQIFFLSFLNQ